MKKSEIQKITDKEARKATEQLREHLKDTVNGMAKDQADWLDRMMADLLPPRLYEAGKHGDLEHEIAEYVSKHKIQVVFIPDRQAIRIMVGDQIHSQFIPEYTVDGEPVEMTSQSVFGQN